MDSYRGILPECPKTTKVYLYLQKILSVYFKTV
jgi:hypothetical protein